MTITAGLIVGICASILLYLAALWMGMFGPQRGQMLGIPAFLSTVILLVIAEGWRRQGTLFALARHRPIARWVSIVIIFAMLFCAITALASGIAAAVASGSAGVAAGEGHVFAERPAYHLNNHGRDTIVTRERYLVVGVGGLLAWHCFGALFALFALHLAVYGHWPRLLEGRRGSS